MLLLADWTDLEDICTFNLYNAVTDWYRAEKEFVEEKK